MCTVALARHPPISESPDRPTCDNQSCAYRLGSVWVYRVSIWRRVACQRLNPASTKHDKRVKPSPNARGTISGATISNECRYCYRWAKKESFPSAGHPRKDALVGVLHRQHTQLVANWTLTCEILKRSSPSTMATCPMPFKGNDKRANSSSVSVSTNSHHICTIVCL